MIDGGVCTGARGAVVYGSNPESLTDTTRLPSRRLTSSWNRCSKRWGPNNVDWYLRNYRVRRITPVSHRTIHGILVNAGLNNPISAPRRVWGKRRFERVRSIELWQADFRQAGDDKWMISYLDDYSRFTLGSKILYNPTGEYPIHPLIDCIHQYGKPHQLLTDQGTHFIGPRGDLFTFTEFCN